MFFCLMLTVLLALPVTPAFAEAPLSAEEEPDAEQSDIYYNAMIRSIELDKSRWKSFSRSMESGPWFYDTQALHRHGTTVTTMVAVFPHPQKTEIYSRAYGDHTKIRKIIFETEINCTTATYRQPLIRVYGYYAELLAEYSNKNTFLSIKSGTTTDTLRSLVCGPDKKKKR